MGCVGGLLIIAALMMLVGFWPVALLCIGAALIAYNSK